MNKIMKVIVIALAVVPMFIVIGLTFYFGGIKKLGRPSEFKEKQLVLIQAHLDSIKRVESAILLPENVADSTMFGVGRHTKIFEDTRQYERQLKEAQATLDSLEREKRTLDEQEKSIEAQREALTNISRLTEDKNIRRLAQLYDGMKAPQALPLMIKMDDTLAVSILSLMQQRTASKLLGALTAENVEKAARLNKLLAEMGK